jgi:hypothetical protein
MARWPTYYAAVRISLAHSSHITINSEIRARYFSLPEISLLGEAHKRQGNEVIILLPTGFMWFTCHKGEYQPVSWGLRTQQIGATVLINVILCFLEFVS